MNVRAALLNRHTDRHAPGKATAMPARDPWQTCPKTRVVLAASACTPVCFCAVRALTRGGVLTRAQSISRNYRICARFPRVGQRHPPCPFTGRGSDRPRQPAARTSSFDRVWRWPTSAEWRSCRSARDGGTPGESGERHGDGKQLPGASVSDRQDRFIRHPQVMAQATP